MWRFEELARALLGLDDRADADRFDQLEAGLMDRYGLDVDQFDQLVEDILSFCYPLKTPLTETWRHTLGVTSENGRQWTALASKDVTHPAFNRLGGTS